MTDDRTVVAGHYDEGDTKLDQLLVLEPKTKTKQPPFFKVVMLNDDYTPMDFVIQVLTGIFKHSDEDAMTIMMKIHNQGSAVCGIYTRDVAETKIDMVIAVARKNEYPLQCAMERE
jgi:ATP-dependent Clp protease adaptor protein ClpS